MLTHLFSSSRYLVRPSPFSAQKTFERHNSRRKSNISFCSNINLAAANAGAPSSRRGSGIGMNNMQGQNSGYPSPRAPPLVSTKANSLSLPDSPSQAGQARGRSNSLRVSFFSYQSIKKSFKPLTETSSVNFTRFPNRSIVAIFCCVVRIHFVKVCRIWVNTLEDENRLSRRLASVILRH